jgi:hypothetical protein
MRGRHVAVLVPPYVISPLSCSVHLDPSMLTRPEHNDPLACLDVA